MPTSDLPFYAAKFSEFPRKSLSHWTNQNDSHEISNSSLSLIFCLDFENKWNKMFTEDILW